MYMYVNIYIYIHIYVYVKLKTHSVHLPHTAHFVSVLLQYGIKINLKKKAREEHTSFWVFAQVHSTLNYSPE